MSFSALGARVCQNLQVAYLDYFQKNAPEFKTGGDTSTLKYLLSPQNRAGFRQIDVTSIPGKKRGVAFDVEVPMCFNVTAPAGIDCTTTRQVMTDPTKQIVFDLTGPAFRITDGNGAPVKLQIAEADINAHCTETDQSYIQRKLIKFLARFEQAFDHAISAIIATSAGTNAAGAALTQLPFFVTNTATGTSAIHSDSIWLLDQNYFDIMGDGQYALLGGRVLNKMMKLLDWNGLNQAGIDLSSLDSLDPYTYYSRHLDAILGGNSFLQLAPGAAQLVVWNEYAGERRRSVTDLYSNDTVVSPVTGLPIDFKWRFDYDCGVWTFEPFIHAEVAVNIAGGCGPLATTNGIIKYTDCSNKLAAPACPA